MLLGYFAGIHRGHTLCLFFTKRTEGAGAMATSAALATMTGWAVLDRDQRVRVILAGEDAPTAAKEWVEQGFLVLPVSL